MGEFELMRHLDTETWAISRLYKKWRFIAIYNVLALKNCTPPRQNTSSLIEGKLILLDEFSVGVLRLHASATPVVLDGMSFIYLGLSSTSK